MYRQDNVTKPEGFNVESLTQTRITQTTTNKKLSHRGYHKKHLDFRGQDPWVEQDLRQL
jgi:hypothetical protein